MTTRQPLDRRQFLRLLSGWCDGRLSDAEFQRLQQILRQSGEARRLYLQYLDEHASLAADIALTDSALARPVAARGRGRRNVQPMTLALGGMAAAVVLIATLLAVMFTANRRHADVAPPVAAAPDASPDATPDATITRIENARWASAATAMRPGAVAVDQFIELEAGVVEIAFATGARVNVHGPAKLAVTGPNSTQLERGAITALAPPSATGFTVLTPELTLVDRGTEFGVTVTGSGETQVGVFRGEVELHLPTGSKQTVPAGVATRTVSGGQTQRTASYSGPVQVPSQPLVLYCDFDEADARDLSGLGHNGRLVNGVRFSADVPAALSGGRSLLLDSGDDGKPAMVHIPHSGALALNQSMTVSLWVKGRPTGHPLDYAKIISKLGMGGIGWDLAQQERRDGVYVRIDAGRDEGTGRSYNQIMPAVPGVLNGTWRHVAFTMSGGRFCMYVDGRLTGERLFNAERGFDSGQTLVIGAQAVNGERAFVGQVDDVAVFNVALNASEIEALARGTRPWSIHPVTSR